jgi:DNA-directed RNA polymerase subunit RPC12/RpoP
MSDGGKGDSPRPFSVPLKKFDANWDAIFGKKKPADDFKLDCHRCFEENDVMVDRMILCPTCGNKRCPKASDHRLDCTNSNDPGQPGSVYK